MRSAILCSIFYLLLSCQLREDQKSDMSQEEIERSMRNSDPRNKKIQDQNDSCYIYDQNVGRIQT